MTAPGVHTALYYQDEPQLLAAVVPFVAGGLAAGQPAILVLPEPHLAALRAELGPGTDRTSYVDMGQAGRNPARLVPQLRSFVEQHRPTPVRIVSEPVHPQRCGEQAAAIVRHEALVNLEFAGDPVRILCPLAVPGPNDLRPYYERTHPAVLEAGRTRGSYGYTDPHTMLAILNQPLPQPRQPVQSAAIDPYTVDSALRMVATLADKAGLAGPRAADVQQALSQLLAAVDAPVTVRGWVEPDHLVCEVRGPGEISDLMAGRAWPAADSPRARALAAANALCDLVQTYVTATVTIIRLRLARS